MYICIFLYVQLVQITDRYGNCVIDIHMGHNGVVEIHRDTRPPQPGLSRVNRDIWSTLRYPVVYFKRRVTPQARTSDCDT